MNRVIFLTTAAFISTACSIAPLLPSQKSEHYSFYEERCGSCHNPVAPEHHYGYQWERLLTLIERGLEPQHGAMQPPLSAKDKVVLLEYLKAFSLVEKTEGE